MATQYLESTDHYDLSATIGLKWTQNILNAAESVVAPAGRGARAILLKNGVFKTLSYQTSWFVGMALNFVNPVGGGLLYQLSAANSSSGTFATLRIENDGSLSILAGNNLNLIANSAPFVILGDVWNYFEIGVQLTGTTPIMATVTLRVNGVELLTGTASTNVDASSTIKGTNQANCHAWFGNANARDFYINDGSGAGSQNGFMGDVAISALFPRADVTYQWTSVGGVTSTGFDHCNPQFPETNDDTTYIESDTPSQIANFDWQPITPFTGTIPAIHFGVYNRKDAEGTRTIQQTTHGTANGPVISAGESYQYNFFAMDEDPATGLPWTQAGFNAATFGVNLVS